ncbi:MAG: hypothetical protein IV086_02060 [Hyphomonadaceae bacterium]|nr:MAG: Uncharacterized protein FD160_1072 [Caulobacteraceae bacterium]MBT9444465.1 hypothetical protein [Hyphomonadaceae bacterium]
MLHRWALAIGLAMLAAAGCAPASPREQDAVAAPVRPRPEMAEAFDGCTWGEVSGVGLAVHSFACGPEKSSLRLVVDEGMPGFAIESTDGGGHPTRQAVIQIFAKEPDEPIEVIVPAIAALSPALDGGSCTLAPAGAANPRPADGRVRYIWAPTGDVKTRWEAARRTGAPMPPPCGALGVQYTGDITFEALKDDPAKVVSVSWDAGAQIFDPSTIKSTESPAN